MSTIDIEALKKRIKLILSLESGSAVREVITDSGAQSGIVATTYTDEEGNFVFENLFDGNYAIRTEEDGVYTAVLAVAVSGSDPAPVSVEPGDSFLPPTLDAPWNTSLGMVNVAELSNNNNAPVIVTATMRDALGQTIKVSQFELAAQSKFDFLISDFVPPEAFGTIQVTVSGSNTDAFRCDIAHYRLAPADSQRSFDFAYSIPCQVPNYGNTAVLTNTIFPGISESSRSVSNWLTLANLSASPQTFTVRAYSEDGLLLDTQAMLLNPLVRSDLDLAHPARITLVTITPDIDSVPYLAVLSRYDTGSSNTRALGFGSHAQVGDAATRCVPISNIIGSSSFTELGNAAQDPATVVALIYSSDGSLVDSGIVALPGFGVRHLDFASQLPINTSGSLCLNTNVEQSLIFNQATYYFSAEQELLTAFLTTSKRSSGVSSVFGAKNFFFNAYNWLRVLNLSDSASTIEVNANPGDSSELIVSYNLAPRERLDIALHDSPFAQVLNTYGRFSVNGLVAADVVRVIPLKNAPVTTGNVLSTTVR